MATAASLREFSRPRESRGDDLFAIFVGCRPGFVGRDDDLRGAVLSVHFEPLDRPGMSLSADVQPLFYWSGSEVWPCFRRNPWGLAHLAL